MLIDSEPVECALVKGYSSWGDLCELIEVFWDLVLSLQSNVFIDRISSDASPADWPALDQLEIGPAAGLAHGQVPMASYRTEYAKEEVVENGLRESSSGFSGPGS